MLKLSPSAFRAMSMVEYKLAVEGYLESQGITLNKMTWQDVEDIMEKYDIPERTGSIKDKAKHGARNRSRHISS